MVERVTVEMKGLTVRYLGKRKRQGKPDGEYFKAEMETPFGPELVNITGNGVEVGKKYDLRIMIGTYQNKLWFKNLGPIEAAKKF